MAGAATFAAFPAWYGTMFSAFYVALMLVLVFLIVRVVSFEWRSKSESGRWRSVWTWANTVGSFGIALMWGIGLSNLVSGVPIDSDGNFTGALIDLFSPYTVFAGITVVLLFAFHGATFLTLRVVGSYAIAPCAPLEDSRSGRARSRGVPRLDRGNRDRPQRQGPVPPALPAAIGIGALLLAALLLRSGSNARAFAMTGLGTIALVATLFTSLYPRVMVSNPDSANSLTVDGAASSDYSLKVMSVVALIFVPLVLLYQGYSYYVFRRRLGGEQATPSAGPETVAALPEPPAVRSRRTGVRVTTNEILLGIGLVLVLAVGSQLLARRLSMPAIVVLLPAGFIAGIATDVVKPEDLLGNLYQPFVSLAVGVILFEAGLRLSFGEMALGAHRVVMRLVVVGVVVTGVGVAVTLALLVAGMSNGVAVQIGAILVVSGQRSSCRSSPSSVRRPQSGRP